MWDESNIEFDPNLCRLCGCNNPRSYHIQSDDYPGNNEGTTLESIIKRLVPLKIEPKDKKPQKVCCDCIDTLKNYDTFISMCLSTDATFNKIIENIKSNQVEDKTNENDRNIIWLQDCKTKPTPEQSSSILLVSKPNDDLTSQNQDFYLMVELNYKEVEIDPLLLKCNENNKSITKESDIQASQVKKILKNDDLLMPKKKEKIKPFECDICYKRFMRRSNLVTHLALHSKERPHKCSECGKNFAKATDLNLHKHLHKGSYTCEVCNKPFVTKSKLERHSKSHSGVKDHACPVCNKMFAEKNNMLVHMSLHSGERPYVCSACNKSFRTHSRLIDHRKVHSSLTPYKCMLCDKSFKWRSTLKTHIQNHSGEKFKCNTCQKEYKIRSCFYKHRKECREGKLLNCEFCSETFMEKDQCENHVNEAHKNQNVYSCEICDSEFGTVILLKAHEESHEKESNN